MFLNELKSELGSICVKHKQYEIVKFLTKDGAVFDEPDTDNLLNMSVACSSLFDNQWEVCSISNYNQNDEKIMKLVFNIPEVNLRIIK